jgi:hypothetical protein
MSTGLGVDATGGPVVDPTENVKSLVLAEKEHHKEIRDLLATHDREIRTAEARYQDDMRAAESAKRDALAAMKAANDALLFSINADAVKTTSELISTQLTKVTDSLSAQIGALTKSFGDQLNASINALSERLREQERFRYEQAGKTSVTDPSTAEALKRIAELRETGKISEGESAGRMRVLAVAVGVSSVLSFLVAAGGLFATIYFVRGGH